MINLIKSLLIKYEKFIKFCVVGLVNATLSILIYNALLYLGTNFNIAYVIAFIITWFNAFYWNGKHVFKAASKKAMLRYFILYLFSMLVGNGILYLLVDGLHMNETLAQFPVIAVGTVINYTGSKFWAFKEEQPHN